MEGFDTKDCIKCLGNKGNYYFYDGDLYTETFPQDWLKSHDEDKTGPKFCVSCRINGTWNGVFIGYCPECAEKYNGKRGSGFIYGRECGSHYDPNCNAFNTYLLGITLDNIGDTDFLDSKNLFSLSDDDSNSSDICELDIDKSYCIEYNDDLEIEDLNYWCLPRSISDEKN